MAKMRLIDGDAAGYFSLSMVMMMVGRFAGTYLMRFIAPTKRLATFALANAVLRVIITQSRGWPSFVALLGLNFFFSTMSPTLLGLKDLGARTQQGSSFLVMTVAGGATFPYLMGKVANHDVAAAYYLLIICYFGLFLFGARLYRVR